MIVEFDVPWIVEPKQGDRSRIVDMSNGRRFVRHYQPVKVKRNSFTLGLLMNEHRPPTPMEGPLRLDVQFRYPWRAGTSKKVRTAGRPVPKDKKPDLDNCLKQLLDTMQSGGFFRNDSQIADLHASKVWCDVPGLYVRLEEISE